MEDNNKKSRTLVGLWDCPYCGAKGLNGLKKRCTNCGHPQDEGTKFYLGTEKEYLSEEEAAEYGKGADWTCAYCGALNRYNAEVCTGCGADREESTGDYFDNEKKQEEKERKRQEEIDAAAQQPAPEPPKKKRSPLLLIILAALIGLFAFLVIPRSGGASVAAKEWTRVLYTENYEDVQRTDWTLPADATLLSSSKEIHHYDSVLDHYEDVRVRRERQVLDHYRTETYTVNNGDGTFTEKDRHIPVYKSEYYYETERQPVYVPVPVVMTKYTYVHKEWVDAGPVSVSGTEEEPYWPDFTESQTARISTRASAYTLTLKGDKNKSYSLLVPENVFTACKVGESVELTLTAGNVTAINGTKIG